MDEEMRRALEADAAKLRSLTGEDHRVAFLEGCEICDSTGVIEGAYSYDDAPCWFCGGSGLRHYE
jgi:hypothetical protein